MAADSERFWEIDALRGIAIAMMILFHFAWDLDFLGFAKIALYENGWLLFQRATISLFLLLVGVSLYISYTRMKERRPAELIKKFGKRSALLFAVALAITIATGIAFPRGVVLFGVIHFIALSTLVAIPFLRWEKLNLVLGLLLLLQGVFFPLPSLDTPGLLWLGFMPPKFYSADYVPLLPWFGLVLTGIFLGKKFYPEGKRNFEIKGFNLPFASLLKKMGRNSLIIYLLHQPVLLGVLYVISTLLRS